MEDFLVFMLIGFGAQLVDGALGMGFGVISASILLGQGYAPALVSASVNAAKIPTGFVAATSHILNRNPDWRIVRRVAIGGVIGGVMGALVLSGLDGPWLHAFVNGYLILIGGLILWRGIFGASLQVVSGRKLGLVGLSGGTVEGIGGSWGPIVTTALLGSGVAPRQAVGSSTVCELMVSIVVFGTLTATYHMGQWEGGAEFRTVALSVAGLVTGGVPAALLGGRLARFAPRRALTIAVGLLALSIALWRMLG